MVLVEPDLPEAGVAATGSWRGRRASVNPSRASRIPHDQYSSWPTHDEQPVSVEHLGMLLQVLADRDVDAEALRCSAHRTNGRSQFHQPAPPLHTDSPSGSAHRKNHRPSRSVSGCIFRRCRLGLDAEPGRQRAFERHTGAAGVERRPAPVVVRVPGGGGEHEQDRLARGTGRRPNHQEGVGALVARGEGHGVVAGSPGSHRDLDRRRPVAAVGCGGGRGRVIGGRHQLRSPHDLTFGSLARDLDVERAGVAGDVEPGGFPGATLCGQQ